MDDQPWLRTTILPDGRRMTRIEREDGMAVVIGDRPQKRAPHKWTRDRTLPSGLFATAAAADCAIDRLYRAVEWAQKNAPPSARPEEGADIGRGQGLARKEDAMANTRDPDDRRKRLTPTKAITVNIDIDLLEDLDAHVVDSHGTRSGAITQAVRLWLSPVEQTAHRAKQRGTTNGRRPGRPRKGVTM